MQHIYFRGLSLANHENFIKSAFGNVARRKWVAKWFRRHSGLAQLKMVMKRIPVSVRLNEFVRECGDNSARTKICTA